MTRRSAGVLVAAVVCGGLAHAAGERARTTRLAGADPNELMYLPESRVLKAAALGYTNLLADFVWMRAIQYYGEHRLTDRNYPQAERLFHTIYDLDPAFMGATRFGALVLAQDARDPEGALRLLRTAERGDSAAWEYPFDQAFIQQTIVMDLEAAGRDYKRAAERPGAPDLAVRLAGLSFARLGDHDAARAVWTSILADPPNEMMRRLAERGLRNVELDETEERMTRSVAEFRAKTLRFPKDWTELQAAGFLDRAPVEPFGGRYFIEPADGKVRSTTSIDRDMRRQRDIFAGAVKAAFERNGAYPGTLEDLMKMGLLAFVPSRPLGVALTYDPATGRVAWDPPWPATEDGSRDGETPLRASPESTS